MFAGCCWWRSLAIDGSSGAPRGHGSVMRRPGSQWDGAIERPSAFQAGHIPSWRESCERYALPPVAAVSGWLLLLLSPLLSAAGPVPHLRCLPAAVTAPGPAQAPPPNPIAAEPDGRRVLSRGGAADHEVTPQAPLTGSGCREHSYGGFGGGHPHFLPHAPDLLIRRSRHIVQDRLLRSVRCADIPQLSARDRRCSAAWQQYWQQSRRDGFGARPSTFQAGHIPSCCMTCERPWLLLTGDVCGCCCCCCHRCCQP